MQASLRSTALPSHVAVTKCVARAHSIMGKTSKKKSSEHCALPEAPAASSDSPAGVSKAAKRRLQKKRAKATASAERVAAAQRKAEVKAARAAAAVAAASEPHPTPHPLAFEALEDDHCETAPEAYAHIAPLLRLLAAERGVAPSHLRIFDPYYCNGAVVRHLNELGFAQVHNENIDFYAALRADRLPPFDVVVTNPPYSSDHPQRLLEFLRTSGKPWLALMPGWVCAKPYYEPATKNQACFYVLPRKRCGPSRSALPMHARMQQWCCSMQLSVPCACRVTSREAAITTGPREAGAPTWPWVARRLERTGTPTRPWGPERHPLSLCGAVARSPPGQGRD